MSDYSEFIEKIITVVRSVPTGKVVSYGQVAVYIGAPRAARQVGGSMSRLDGVALPWWRVVNNEGRITIKGNWHNDRIIQRKLLQAEGVGVSDEFTLDMKKYRFIADTVLLEQFRLSEDYITLVRHKYGF